MGARSAFSPSQKASVEAIAQLLETGEYSDLIIESKEKVFKVHRSIVCPRSPMFRSKVERWHFDENAIPRIDLREDDPALVHQIVRYLYHSTYDDHSAEGMEKQQTENELPEELPVPPNKSAEPVSPMIFNARMYLLVGDIQEPLLLFNIVRRKICAVLKQRNCFFLHQTISPQTLSRKVVQEIADSPLIQADYYLIEDLKTLAISKFDQAAHDAAFADWRGEENKFHDFDEAVRLIWTKSRDDDTPLKKVMARFMVRYMPRLKKNQFIAENWPADGDFAGLLLNAGQEILASYGETCLTIYAAGRRAQGKPVEAAFIEC